MLTCLYININISDYLIIKNSMPPTYEDLDAMLNYMAKCDKVNGKNNNFKLFNKAKKRLIPQGSRRYLRT